MFSKIFFDIYNWASIRSVVWSPKVRSLKVKACDKSHDSSKVAVVSVKYCGLSSGQAKLKWIRIVCPTKYWVTLSGLVVRGSIRTGASHADSACLHGSLNSLKTKHMKMNGKAIICSDQLKIILALPMRYCVYIPYEDMFHLFVSSQLTVTVYQIILPQSWTDFSLSKNKN